MDDLLKGTAGFGVNGLTYDREALYGALTFDGRVVRIAISPDGSVGTPEALLEDGSLVGIDGIELDPVGDIYVTNNFAQTIQRIDHTTLAIDTIVVNNGGAPLSSPASMAFSRNHKSIFVANLNESGSVVQGDPDNPLVVEVAFPVPVHAWTAGCG